MGYSWPANYEKLLINYCYSLEYHLAKTHKASTQQSPEHKIWITKHCPILSQLCVRHLLWMRKNPSIYQFRLEQINCLDINYPKIN